MPGKDAAALASRTGRRLTKKGQLTRERIVASAAALMLERGVAGTTIEDIQEAAAVSASQMYHYFADKDSLVSAVIDLQTDQVLGFHHLSFGHVESLDDLWRWRDTVVRLVTDRRCVGGCPIGSLGSELAEIDPIARAQLARSFAGWERILRDGLAAMAAAGQFAGDVDTDRLALALLGSAQGGLLLSQIRRDSTPLATSLDVMIDHIGCQLTDSARAGTLRARSKAPS
jgi:TetR/AcrR family transcriptional regulator, transcriptional repressor for nem operon